mmetsp:Transcript_60317/g.106818  ORF Transcript_60317/g.106818 Transcript_60317/m.106818 type:complete len:210 (+) Transcript_60317:82-711(+)
MNVTEIVDHAAVRSIRHGLRHVEHDAVLLLPPYRARVEELGLVAVQACLCGIGTGWRCSIDQVLQLASPFYFGKFVAAPDRAVRTIWLIRKSERVHPIGGVALIEGDGLANAYVDRRRGAVKACEHVIARLRSEWVEADTERSFIRCAAIDRASGYRRVGGLGDKLCHKHIKAQVRIHACRFTFYWLLVSGLKEERCDTFFRRASKCSS